MQNAHDSRAITAGFVATLAMTMVMYAAPLMGMPRMDIAAMLGSLFNGGLPPAAMTGMWWMGMLLHFLNGAVIFALLYSHLVYAWMPGKPWMRGALWGVTLWFIAQAVVMPMMGAGFFSANSPMPVLMVMGSLIGHLIYGSVLGALAGVQATRTHFEHQERHA